MKRPELLAPAGSMESLKAAIEAGCDAVYLGGKLFGARSFATNFNDEELIEAVNYAHLYGVKVYVTVNTLIYDNEVSSLLEYAKFLHEINVDALIMQDIGMINLIRQVLPNLDIHASTQLHIHNLSGAKVVEDMGLTRTVLARETSIEEIKSIKDKTDIELEIFVHGALCISYSGQCLMSSLIGGRSGNRGACAGSCRLQYDLIDSNNKKINKDKYLLSTKDLNSLENIGSLIDIGVDSFKIEGRMKRPEYVYLVVSLYRKAIDSYIAKGKVDISDLDIYELKKIFNREFTKGFLFNEDNNELVNQYRPNHMGVCIGKVIKYKNDIVSVKLTENVCVGDGIRIVDSKDVGLTLNTIYKNHSKVKEAYKGDIISFKIPDFVSINSEVLKTTDVRQLDNINNLSKQNKRKVLISGSITLKVNEPIVLEISDGNNIINVSYGQVYEAKNAPVEENKIIDQLSKLGNTIYQLEQLDVLKDDNIFVNIKDLNEIRRLAIDNLNTKRLVKKEVIEGVYKIKIFDYKRERNTNIKIPNMECYNKLDNSKYKYIYVDDIDLYNSLNDDKKVYMTNRVIKDYPIINNLVQIEEFGGVKEYNSFMTGAFLNVTNSYTLAYLHSIGSSKVTLSYELTYDRVEELMLSYKNRYHKNPNVEVIIYGNEEAMISKFNLLKKFNLDGEYYLKDRFNNNYPIRIKDDKMIIYNYKPRNDKTNYFDIGVNNVRIDILNINQLNKCELITKK